MSGSAPVRALSTTAGVLELGEQPLLMGVVNATPDSFSDGGSMLSDAERVQTAHAMAQAGAAIIDVGGESAVTNRPAVTAAEEIERVVPLIGRLRAELDVLVSVDTYKPEVARAAIEAGAAIVNDTSGLRDPAVADVCAASGAALVLMHTLAAPKQKVLDTSLDGRMLSEVASFLRARIRLALERGVSFEQLVLDPGPDFGKTPAQTIEALRGLSELHALGRPLLLAVSRKDFVGALTARAPRERLAGTLAAVAHGVECGAHIVRVHDVRQTRDFLTVLEALRGRVEVDSELQLPDRLRWQQAQAP